ncbi:hypothetical protein V5799_009700 [Amblyomma americanum]|uniref:Secreted protein n=1 Tax=Amblyomma americanum TaxID=6943 RepID=A0AAQ4FB92_AMBAM
MTMMVAGSLLVLMVMCVVLGSMCGGPRQEHLDFRLPERSVARKLRGNFSIHGIGGSAAGSPSGGFVRPSNGESAAHRRRP